MPHSSDDQPSTPAASVEGEAPSANTGEAPDGANPLGPSSSDSEPFQRHRRRRRRRRPPPPAASQGTALADETMPEETPPAADAFHDTQVNSGGDAGDAEAPRP